MRTEARILLRPTHGVASPPDRIEGPDAGARFFRPRRGGGPGPRNGLGARGGGGGGGGGGGRGGGHRAGGPPEPLLKRRGPGGQPGGGAPRHEIPLDPTPARHPRPLNQW